MEKPFMQSRKQPQVQGFQALPRHKSNTLGKIAAIVFASFVALVLVITLGLSSAYSDMAPHEQKLVNALKDDLLAGHWGLEKTRDTAEQNAQESREKLRQSTKRLDEAERNYEQSLAEQKRIVAAAAKRRAKKAAEQRTIK